MEFKEFKIEDLFEVKTTKGLDEGKLTFSESGDYNFVGRTKKNNGIKGRISKQSFDTNAKNTISVSQIGTITACYQPEEWYGSQNMFCLASKNELTKNKHLYFVAVLNAYLRQYANSGRSVYPTLTSLKNAKIQLPVTPSGEIDFDYIEQHIEKIEKQYIEKIALMLKASGLDNYQLTEEEKAVLKEEKEKKEFKIEDLWVVDDWVYGKDKKWKTQFDCPIEGSLPVISGQTTNNGVKYYTSDNYSTNEVFEDCLTMTTRGESGRVFYHPGKFLLANNVLVMKMPKYSKNVMLYLGTVIEKVCRSTNYSVYPTKDSLKTKTIFLPVTPTEEIDFDYMEKYISAIIKTKIKNVVLEINKKLELYKQTQN